jgi:hypothetical protein
MISERGFGMDDFVDSENQPPQPPEPKKAGLDWLWNLLTIFILLAALGIIAVVAQIYNNPSSALNPFPFPTLIPTLFIPTRTPMPATPTATAVAATVTPQVTITPSYTPLPTPTAIQATPLGPDKPTPTATVRGSTGQFSFVVEGEPRGIESSLLNPGRTCQWMGIAGQVNDLQNRPVPLGIIVQLNGAIDGKVLNLTNLTGTARQYGESGYEFTLAERSLATKGQVSIRLLNQEGIPISDRVYFDTFAECNKNLIIINFKQVK